MPKSYYELGGSAAVVCGLALYCGGERRQRQRQACGVDEAGAPAAAAACVVQPAAESLLPRGDEASHYVPSDR